MSMLTGERAIVFLAQPARQYFADINSDPRTVGNMLNAVPVDACRLHTRPSDLRFDDLYL